MDEGYLSEGIQCLYLASPFWCSASSYLEAGKQAVLKDTQFACVFLPTTKS